MIDSNILDKKLRDNYIHHLNTIEELDYPGSRSHLSCEDVLDAHYLICQHFLQLGEGIGGFGPKDISLLTSAVARQLASAGGSFVYNDAWEIGSSLLYGLINNHPFYDANKRTAFLSGVFFMLENNYVPRADIKEIEDFTVEIAEFNHKNGRHMMIEEITPRFRSMFRRRNNSGSYIVTYRELDNILSSHGCSLKNPQGNYIDVYKGDIRVSQIGFPSWGKEVGRNAISTVRKTTGLTSEAGYDSEVFFRGADPLSTLIREYEEPLRRLADR